MSLPVPVPTLQTPPTDTNCTIEIQSTDGELYQLKLVVVDAKIKLEFSLVNTISPILYESLYAYDDLNKVNKFFSLYESCEEVYVYLKYTFQSKDKCTLQLEGKNLLLSFQPFEKYSKIIFTIPQKDGDLQEIVQLLCKGINQLRKENKEIKEELQKKGEIIEQMKTTIDKMSSEIQTLKTSHYNDPSKLNV